MQKKSIINQNKQLKMSLIDLITGSTGEQVAQEGENRFGISKGQMLALLAVAAPLIISYLKKNSEDRTQADSLNSALDRDHDGSILDNVSQSAQREQEGGSILDHVFGQQKPQVETQLSEQTGISMDKIGPLLGMLAPIVMGYLGRQKQQAGVNDGGGLSDLLGGILNQVAPQQQQQQSNPLNDLLGSVLGGGNQQQSQNGNILGDLLSAFTKK